MKRSEIKVGQQYLAGPIDWARGSWRNKRVEVLDTGFWEVRYVGFRAESKSLKTESGSVTVQPGIRRAFEDKGNGILVRQIGDGPGKGRVVVVQLGQVRALWSEAGVLIAERKQAVQASRKEAQRQESEQSNRQQFALDQLASCGLKVQSFL